MKKGQAYPPPPKYPTTLGGCQPINVTEGVNTKARRVITYTCTHTHCVLTWFALFMSVLSVSFDQKGRRGERKWERARERERVRARERKPESRKVEREREGEGQSEKECGRQRLCHK